MYTLADRVTTAGHSLSARKVVKDDIRAIRHVVRDWTNRNDVDVIITTGGTGLTGHDVTIEAMRPLFEKEIDGFGTLFHMVSFPKIGTSTVQSRATAGVMKGRSVCLLLRDLPSTARTAGTSFSSRSSIIRTSPAISSRSCRGLKSTRSAARPRRGPSRTAHFGQDNH